MISRVGMGISAGRGRLAVLVCVLAFASLAFGSASASAAGATRHVATTGANAGNDCLLATAPCATIQHAIGEASAGDTVQVAAGSFVENLTIPKTLTLRGPNSDVDPNTGTRGAEAVIDGGNGNAIVPQAEGIVIDGFTVSTGPTGNPIRTVGADVDSLKIADDIVGSGVAALRLEAGGEDIAVERNRIAGNEFGIAFGGAATYTDLAIKDNVVSDTVDLYGIFGGGTIEGFELVGNTIEATVDIGANTSDAVVTTNDFDVESPGEMNMQMALHESTVTGNSFEGNGTTSCLQLFGSQFGLVPSREVLVSDNSFHACNAYGIQLSPDVEAIEITGNTITGSYDGVNTRSADPWDVTGQEIHVVANRITGSTHMGVDNTVSGTLDARDNWWGCNAGPGAPGCDAVGAGVDASTHVVLSASASAAEIGTGQSATVTARLDTDNTGAFVAGVPGTVGFGSRLGSFSPPLAPLVNGVASSSFAAGAQPGSAAIAVELDNQQVAVPLSIVGPPPAVIETPLAAIEAPPAAIGATIDTPDKPVSVQGKTPVLGTLTCASACRVGSKSAAVEIGGASCRERVYHPV